MGSTGTDIDQQKDIGKAFFYIARLEGDIKNLTTAVIGIDGNNGLRGELREFMAQIGRRMESQEDYQEKLSRDLQHYLDVGRAETCIGKAALEDYVSQVKIDEQKIVDAMATREKRDQTFELEIKKSRITMLTAIIVAALAATATIASNLIK